MRALAAPAWATHQARILAVVAPEATDAPLSPMRQGHSSWSEVVPLRPATLYTMSERARQELRNPAKGAEVTHTVRMVFATEAEMGFVDVGNIIEVSHQVNRSGIGPIYRAIPVRRFEIIESPEDISTGLVVRIACRERQIKR